MAAKPCVLPDGYKDVESALANLSDAIATQKPEFYALKLVALNGQEGSKKDAQRIVAKVNQDLGLEFTEDYFGPAKLEKILNNPTPVLDEIIKISARASNTFPTSLPLEQISHNPETAAQKQPTIETTQENLEQHWRDEQRTQRNDLIGRVFVAVTAIPTAVAAITFGCYQVVKNIALAPKPQPQEQHLIRRDADKAVDAMLAQPQMEKYMDKGGVASTDPAIRNATLQEYQTMDKSRGVESGTTHKEMDAIANLTNGKQVFSSAMYYHHREISPGLPLVKDWEALKLQKVPVPDEVAAYIKSHQGRD
jgi:hypothetical protein